jgi:hypothetical protein
VLLIPIQLRIYRQCQQFPASPLGFRKIAFVVTEAVEALLPMERHRIIDLCRDAFDLEVGLELVPFRHANTVISAWLLAHGELHAEDSEPVCQFLVIGNHHPSVAKTTQILAREEGEASGHTHTASSSLISIFGSDCLRGIFH